MSNFSYICTLLSHKNLRSRTNRVVPHQMKMNKYTSQEETRRNIIKDMVKKRNSIVPVIGEDTIVFPFALLWLSYGALKWIRSAFEEGLKVMRRYALLRNVGLLPCKAYFVAPRTYVLEVMNIGSMMKPCNVIDINLIICMCNIFFAIDINAV